ncbi:hypothetical protein Btru_047826 [Bulinus truncatus]|nr:hypothetical protein Btru_047826 [Bulinus truncatus]
MVPTRDHKTDRRKSATTRALVKGFEPPAPPVAFNVYEPGITLDKHFVMAVPKLNNVWDLYTKMPKILFYIFTNSLRAIQGKKGNNNLSDNNFSLFIISDYYLKS